MKKSLLTIAALLLGFASADAQTLRRSVVDNFGQADSLSVIMTRGALGPAGHVIGRVNDTLGWVNPSAGSGTVSSVGMTVPTGLSVSGSPITTSGTLSLTYAAGYVGYTTTEASKLSGIASGATNNPSTTVGANLLNLTNPSAVRYIRINADNTVTPLDAADFRTDIGAPPTASPAFTGTATFERVDGQYAEFDTLNVGVVVGGGELDSLVLSGETPGDMLTTNGAGRVVSNDAFAVGVNQIAFFNGTLVSQQSLSACDDGTNPVTQTQFTKACIDAIVTLLRAYNLAPAP